MKTYYAVMIVREWQSLKVSGFRVDELPHEDDSRALSSGGFLELFGTREAAEEVAGGEQVLVFRETECSRERRRKA